MKKLPLNSHIITGKSAWHIDSTIRNELGWGSHTVDTVLIAYDSINSHAALYVAESCIMLSLVADPDVGSSTRAVQDANYSIDFTSIIDVVMKDDGTADSTETNHQRLEAHRSDRFTTLIYLKGQKMCSIENFHSDFLGKHIKSVWESDLARRSCFVGKLVTTADPAITAEYYRESVACLAEAQTYAALIEVAEDFSAEVLLDLELKVVTLESREMMLLALEIIEALTSKPAIFAADTTAGASGAVTEELLPVPGNYQRILFREKIRPSQRFLSPATTARSAADASVVSAGSFAAATEEEDERMSPEQHRKLKMLALQRLKIINSMLKLLSSVLFASESVFPRINVLLGPSPLEWGPWLTVLVSDLHKKVSTALGCAETSEAADIGAQIAMNLEEDHSRRSRNSSARDATRSSEDAGLQLIGTPRKALNTALHGVADGIVTPRSARGNNNSSGGFNSARGISSSARGSARGNQMAENPFVLAMQQLTAVCQALKDVQSLLLCELYRITMLGKALLRRGQQQQQQRQTFALLQGESRFAGLRHIQEIRNIGDCFVRQPDWEDALESMISRVVTVLEDMLSTGHINMAAAPTNKEAAAVPSTPRQHPLFNSYGSGNRLSAMGSGRFSSDGPLPSASFRDRPSPFTPAGAAASTTSGAGLAAVALTPRRPAATAATSTINAVPPSPSAAMRRSRFEPVSTPATTTAGGGRSEVVSNSFRFSFNLSDSSDNFQQSEVSHARSVAVLAASSGKASNNNSNSASGKFFEVHSPFSRKNNNSGNSSNNNNSNNSSGGNLNNPATVVITAAAANTTTSTNAGNSSRPPLMLQLPLASRSPMKALDLGGGVAELQQQESREGVGLLKFALRTQEILAFQLLLLLCNLAMDSSRVREAMRGDLRSYWSSILGIFNQIIPRPRSNDYSSSSSGRQLQQRDQHGDLIHATDTTAALANSSAAERLQTSRQRSSSSDKSRSRYVQKFLRVFSNAPAADPTTIGTPAAAASEVTATAEGTFSGVPGIIADDLRDAEQYSAPVALAALPLTAYGPPQYGLSASSWLLLLRARQSLERIAVLLDFKPSQIDPPESQQQQKQRQQRRDGSGDDAATAAANRNNDDDSSYAFFGGGGGGGFHGAFNRDNIHFDTLSEEDESTVTSAKDDLQNLGLDDDNSSNSSRHSGSSNANGRVGGLSASAAAVRNRKLRSTGLRIALPDDDDGSENDDDNY